MNSTTLPTPFRASSAPFYLRARIFKCKRLTQWPDLLDPAFTVSIFVYASGSCEFSIPFLLLSSDFLTQLITSYYGHSQGKSARGPMLLGSGAIAGLR